ncbi:FecR family protein [Cyclobacterium xiamenense]|uniref:FecR family protein n=1 Tax=Cyclobacterium xiamenense TaxID=1297121 RepID=UPI0012B7AFF5|nr:FecR domain-containing protein [Cyclobacterium xiamenense]
MKTYSTIEEFLEDKSFVDWVLDPVSAANGDFWKQIASDKVNGLLLNQARLIIEELNAPGEDWEKQEELQVLSKIHEHIQKNKRPILNTRRLEHAYWKVAQKVFFVVFASVVTFLAVDVVQKNKPSAPELVENPIYWISKSNPKGQKSAIHLPDGSSVIINSESEIRYRSDFGDTNRELYLVGESFFEVAPDSLLPFRVFSGNITTTALGTSFNINSYNSNQITVQLATGIVEVVNESQANQSIFLQPGEEVTSVGTERIVKGRFDLKKAFLWKSGVLLFENFSVDEFTQTLERWYGVEISLENRPHPGLKISGEFQDTYLSDVLESIGYAYGFDYTIDQKKVKLVFAP